MKILYYFYELDTPMYQWQRIHFMNELKCHNIEFITFNPSIYETPEIANEVFVKMIHNFEDIEVFMSCVESKWLYNETVLLLKDKLQIPTVLICWDNLELPFKQKEISKAFDLIWLTSQETEYLFKSWGCKTVFATYAANPYVFKSFDSAIQSNTIGFVGSPYGSRVNKINNITSSGIKCEIYSNNLFSENNFSNSQTNEFDYYDKFIKLLRYLRFSIGRKVLYSTIVNQYFNRDIVLVDNENLLKYRSVSFEKMIELYSEFSISLNISELRDTYILNHPIYKMHLRTFEIPMSGGLQMTHYNDEIVNYFEENSEIILYKNNEELIDKSKYYLRKANHKLIFEMKRNARLRAENDHTWYRRFKTVFNELNISI